MSQRSHNYTKQNKRKKRWLLSIAPLLILVVATVLAVGHFHGSNSLKKNNGTDRPVNSVDYSKSSSTENQVNDVRKSSSTSQTLTSGTAKVGTTSSNQTASSASITITRASSDGTNLQVGTLIDGATTGTCTLTASQTGQASVTRLETVEQQNNTYDCPVFSIPVSDFSNQGMWNVSVTLVSNGQTTTGTWLDNPVSLAD